MERLFENYFRYWFIGPGVGCHLSRLLKKAPHTVVGKFPKQGIYGIFWAGGVVSLLLIRRKSLLDPGLWLQN
eukprot:scaffold1138_cov128-Cylindrotheca_fusiformis.AAC.32